MSLFIALKSNLEYFFSSKGFTYCLESKSFDIKVFGFFVAITNNSDTIESKNLHFIPVSFEID